LEKQLLSGAQVVPGSILLPASVVTIWPSNPARIARRISALEAVAR